MITVVTIQNLKCEGRKNPITMKLDRLEGIKDVDIDLESKSIRFDYKTHNTMEGLRMELIDMGYLITGNPNTIVNKSKAYMIGTAAGKLTS